MTVPHTFNQEPNRLLVIAGAQEVAVHRVDGPGTVLALHSSARCDDRLGQHLAAEHAAVGLRLAATEKHVAFRVAEVATRTVR